jgi:hypothetical protein
VDWIFNLDDPEFIREMKLSSINYIIDTKAKAMISDHTETKTAQPQAVDWISEHWYGNAYKYGFRFEAIIKPQTAVGSISVSRIEKQGKQKGVEIVECTDFDTAYNACINYLKNNKK